MTYLRNRSNITFFTSLYTTEQVRFLALWFDVLRMLSNDSSTRVASSLVIRCFTAAFDPSTVRLFFGLSSILLCQSSVTPSPLAWGTVSHAIGPSLFKLASPDGWGMLLCGSATAVYKDSSLLSGTMWFPRRPSAVQRQCTANRSNGTAAYRIGENIE